MIYVIVLTFQYLAGFSDIRLSSIEEHQELSYINNVKDGFIQTLNTSNISNNGDMNKMVKDIDFTKNFFKQELLKKGIAFDSKFIFFSNSFESNDLSDWTNVYGTPQLVNYTASDGISSLYSNVIEYVTKNLSGVSEVYARAYVNFRTMPLDPSRQYFINLYENGNQFLGLGLWNNNGVYEVLAYSNVYNDAWSSSGISISSNEWHYFELYWLENDTNSTIEAWYDGQLEINNHTTDSSGHGKLINQYNFGGVDIGGGGTPDLYVDCIAVSSDYVGDKCYPSSQNYFDFSMETIDMHTETEFPYQEIISQFSWFNNYNNNTLVGQPTLFSLNWVDTVGMSGYIFSFDNCTGSLANSTWMPMSGLSNLSSAVKTISSVVGCTIRWQVYANDTSGKWATSDIFSFPTTGLSLQIQFVNPTDNDGATVFRNWSYVNVSIIDSLNTSSFIDWNRSLIGYWAMDWYNSTGIFDNSTWNNFGNFNGANFGQSNITTGQYGNGLNFDGYDDKISISDSSIFNTTDELTVSAWVYPLTNQSTGGSNQIVLKFNYGTSQGFFLREGYNQSHYVQFSVGNGTNSTGNCGFNCWQYANGGYITANNWHFIVGTVKANDKIMVYVDGILKSQNNYLGIINQSANNVYIGWESGTKAFNGTIDEVSIWNRVLSPEEINASYNSGINRLYHNFTNLSNGVYQYYACAIDTNGNNGKTETRSITSSQLSSNLWLKFNEASGTKAFDSSQYNNDGTFYGESFNDGTLADGTCSPGVGFCPSRVAGNSGFGNALDFDGTGDYVRIPDSSSLDINDTFTIAAWINPHSWGGSSYGRIVQKYSFISNTGYGYMFYVCNDTDAQHSLRFYGGNVSNTGFQHSAANDAVSLNKWQHVAVTYNRTHLVFFVDGLEKGIISDPNHYLGNSNDYLYIGNASYDRPYNGLIDEVRIWNRSLNRTEIQAEMSSSMPVSRPVASYSFEEPTLATYVNDSHIWLNGTYGSALSFDGANDYVEVDNVPVNTSIGAYNTVAFWMYWNGGTVQIPFNFGNPYYDLFIQSSTCMGFNTGNGDAYGINPTSLINKWAFVTLVFYNGAYTGNNKIYINDTEQAPLSQCYGNAQSGNSASTVYIGRWVPSNPQYFFNGTIDEVRIWNRMLSSTEIQAEMYKG
jgi:hypothetical protein